MRTGRGLFPRSRPSVARCIPGVVFLGAGLLCLGAPGRRLSGVALLGAAGSATELTRDGTTLFRADSPVTVGISYGERAIKATLSTPAETPVLLWTGKQPRNVFVGRKKLPARAWSYERGSTSVRLTVGKGASDLQVRFDALESLEPFELTVPLVACGSSWQPGRELGFLRATCADERISGSLEWTQSPGLYLLRARRGGEALPDSVCSLTVQGGGAQASEAPDVGLFLEEGAKLCLEARAPGNEVPLDTLQCRLKCVIASMQRVPRAGLPLDRGVLVEGEAFSAEGGGEVKKSTEHGNTHGGGCIYTWADAGHWISWQVNVPRDGMYTLTFVAATAEDVALRSLSVDGLPLPGAEIIEFTRTGGWGRVDAEEWQPFQPVGPEGEALAVLLERGKHTLRLENLRGQHLNIDCILLTPMP